MSFQQTDYEEFEESSVENRRRLREEELILEVTETLCDAMEARKISKSQVATNLGKTKGFVSQLLAGGRNLTLRSIADVADAVGCQAHFVLTEPLAYAVTNSFGGPVPIYPLTNVTVYSASDLSQFEFFTTPMNITVDKVDEEDKANGAALAA